MSGNICGVDIGTMNLVSAKFDLEKAIDVKSLRNMFLKIEDNLLTTTEIDNIDYDHIKAEEDGEPVIYLIGEECFKMARRFGLEVRRPMEGGVISTKDVDAMDILTKMVEKLIGKTEKGICVYSVPAKAVDNFAMPPISYHERVFKTIFSALGYEAKPINEAMAIIFAECEEENFSGITISFGCGLTNVACAYKGIPVMTFSVNKGGDWIDTYVSQSLNIPVARVTALKESKLNFNLTCSLKTKKERQVIQALKYAYQDLVHYCINTFVRQFNNASDKMEIDEVIPIVVSGGTSMPPGFLKMFKDVFKEKSDFPYKISEIRQTDNPLGAVATGALIYAIWKEGIEKKGESGL